MLELNKIYNADCLDLMKEIDDKSVHMILCDLPYGTTACKWDTIIPFEPLWKQYKRIIKDNGAIVLTASQPFASQLVMSNPKWFKYEWIWNKVAKTGHLSVGHKPLMQHENVIVFGDKKMNYFPQMTKGKTKLKGGKEKKYEGVYGITKSRGVYLSDSYYPSSILVVTNSNNLEKTHPTQKPVALFEYLIKTYTNEKETVLDNCSGSGTTAIACVNTNRNFICIEKDKDYYEKSVKRYEEHIKQLKLL